MTRSASSSRTRFRACLSLLPRDGLEWGERGAKGWKGEGEMVPRAVFSIERGVG
jgi:hypothetical protein